MSGERPSLWFRCYKRILDFLFYLPCGGEAAFRHQCVEFIGVAPGGRVLDLCCGAGELTLPLARKGRAAEIVGVDISALSIRKARSNAEDLPVSFVESPADALPLEDSRFDKCIVSLGLHHLSPAVRQGALKEARRSLADGGSLYVIEYNLPANLLWRAMALLLAWLDSSREALRMMRSGSLDAEVRQAGFEIRRRDTICHGVIGLLEAVGP